MDEEEVVWRYREVRRRSRALKEVGSLTAEVHVRSLDPHGVLTLAVQVGEARAAEILRAELLTQTGGKNGTGD
jgi:hypothetical protein